MDKGYPIKILKRIYNKLNREINLVREYSVVRREFNKSKNPRLIMLGTPNYGNLGDHAIAHTEKHFMLDNFKKNDYIEISLHLYKKRTKQIMEQIKEHDLILIHGGGFIGDLWPEGDDFVRDVLNRFSNQIIIFPQTIYFNNTDIKNIKKMNLMYDKENVSFFVRDKKSYDFLAENNFNKLRKFMVPDIVLYSDVKERGLKRNGILFCLRNDKEKVLEDSTICEMIKLLESNNIKYEFTDTVISQKLTRFDRDLYLLSKYKQFAKYDLVVTDRLHGMIFSYINNTPCIVFDNVSKKISGVKNWIKTDNIKLQHHNLEQEELQILINECVNRKKINNRTLSKSNFNSLKEEINFKLAMLQH